MNRKKLILLATLAISSILLILLIRTSSAPEKPVERDPALSLLLPEKAQNEGEIFTSRFWKEGEAEIKEETGSSGGEIASDSEFLEPADPENPINPDTNLPYSNEDMAQLRQMQDLFPRNRLIPRKLDAGLRQAEEARRNAEDHRNLMVLQGTGNREQILEFLADREAFLKDKMELLEYFLSRGDNDLDESTRSQLVDLRRTSKSELDGIPQAKALASEGKWLPPGTTALNQLVRSANAQ